jgi:hydrogenase expression/formation protein HypE
MMFSRSLECPLPQLDFDVITLGHGSGGLLTQKLLKSGVFQLLKNPQLNSQHDGAFLDLQGEAAFTTDSFVISPIFFPGGNIGELAVNGTVNDLAMCGSIPNCLSLSFIIEEGLRVEEFWEVLLGVKSASERSGVKIITGDTKVVEKGKGDKIFINTSGIGMLHHKARIGVQHLRAGDKIIVSGEVATHGVAIMSVRRGLEFETDIKSDTTNVNYSVMQMLDLFGEKIHMLRDPTRGGIATVLKEIAEQSNMGIEVFQKDIPIDERVDSACELLGLDPLYVANEGIFISIVDPGIADNFVECLRKTQEGLNARCIGTMTREHPEQVLLTSNVRGRRLLNLLPGELLPRIC